MKVSIFNKRLMNIFYAILSVISVITSIMFVFIEMNKATKTIIGVSLFIILVLTYLFIWIYWNKKKSIHLKVNNSKIEVKFGDIFAESADFKVVAFNEYFDTIVDDKIIAKATLNGIFINKFFKDKVGDLDEIISSDTHLNDSIITDNNLRRSGKKIKYKLGTICVVNDYFLTALTHFDNDNRAYLEMNDFISCMLNFWNEVDRVYAGKTIALPVLGSGITRFKGYDSISDQELLELIIWTFKVSRIKFTYPSKVKIVVYKGKSDKINLIKLKDLETN
ncbi:macro domain-containing protein [Clostridium butyricum]|uniref:macro domain-containing protein n=1 Tax=Clostridium butyricum TaxID=1492 RepID=UPI0018AA8D17|nr:macro domain-containing protein [Clostridium butyricum]